MSKLKILRYFLKLTWKLKPSYIPTVLLSAVIKAITPFINIVIPKFIIDELMGDQSMETISLYIGILVCGNLLLRIINKFFEALQEINISKMFAEFDNYLGVKCMNMDFEFVENPEILDLKERARFAIYNMNAIGQVLNHLSNIVYTVTVISGLTYLLFILNPLLLLGVILIVGINTLIFKRIQKIQFMENQKAISGNRAYGFLIHMSYDFALAKDIRLYNGLNLVIKKVKFFTDEIVRIYSAMFTTMGKYTGLTKVNVQIQMIVVYGYLAARVIAKAISIGDFTMYAGAVSNFSTSISSLIESIIQIGLNCNYLELFKRFDEMKSKVDEGTRLISELEDYSIVFEDVSFKYPNKDVYVLKHINIKIEQGEKLSIVGLNGAGKTTFIKLLARLYQPSQGKITIGGIDINEFDYDSYMELMSIVFQDFKLLSYSVNENVTKDTVTDDQVLASLEKAGFSEDLEQLKHGLSTCVYKNFDREGVEFSGGQAQKIAIARALYKDAPIAILDEPTSALDPISEYQVYKSFNQMVSGKTAIYISHRMSSTRFSDCIAVFNDGEIVEYGTHQNLIDLDGLYAEMYQTQAKYYVA